MSYKIWAFADGVDVPGCSAERGYTAMAAVERSQALQLAAGTAAGHVDVLDIAASSLSASLLAAPHGKVQWRASASSALCIATSSRSLSADALSST